jgi:hypothetical protein
VEEALVDKGLGGNCEGMEQFARLEDILIGEQFAAHELSEGVACVLAGHLWVWHAQLCWGCKELCCHQDALGVLVEVSPLVA